MYACVCACVHLYVRGSDRPSRVPSALVRTGHGFRPSDLLSEACVLPWAVVVGSLTPEPHSSPMLLPELLKASRTHKSITSSQERVNSAGVCESSIWCRRLRLLCSGQFCSFAQFVLCLFISALLTYIVFPPHMKPSPHIYSLEIPRALCLQAVSCEFEAFPHTPVPRDSRVPRG